MEERPDSQDWDDLPPDCPLKATSREEFDELWGGIDTWALAAIDPSPTTKIRSPYAWMFSWLVFDLDSEDWSEKPEEQTRKSKQAKAIQNHVKWLLIDGTVEDLDLFQKSLKKCHTNLHKSAGMKTLRLFLIAAESIEAGYFSANPQQATIPSLAAVKQLCRKEYPDQFPAIDDTDGWRTIERRALKVRPFFRPGKGGRPPGSES
ncbi:hypothetical protein N9A94_01935 [Akkermansiaceae bacterium]|nr:hypothetical protein [Akkermansiaceae bacterium]